MHESINYLYVMRERGEKEVETRLESFLQKYDDLFPLVFLWNMVKYVDEYN